MSMTQGSTMDRDQSAGAPLCDVCSVTRDAGNVTLCFGERLLSETDPQWAGVALRHRVVLDLGVASQLHDLAAQLLSETANQPGRLR